MKKVGKAIFYLIMIAISLVYILPLVMMISISISSDAAITNYGYTLLPKEVSFEAYRLAVQNPAQIIQSYKVTAAFSVLSTVLSTIVTVMAAYPLARSNFRLKKQFTFFLFITTLFSGGMVPTYILCTRYLHLGDTFWIYVLPGMVSAFNVFLYRTSIKELPSEMIEAAKIDGAGEIKIFVKIILPLCVPIMATLGFMNLMGKWNDWNTCLLYIRNPKLYSLQYLLQRIINEADYIKSLSVNGQFSANDLPSESLKYATALIASGPMMVIFPLFQKYLSKGITMGSVKG